MINELDTFDTEWDDGNPYVDVSDELREGEDDPRLYAGDIIIGCW
jgi:hypothetical protein